MKKNFAIEYAWGHLDHLIVGHLDPVFLKELCNKMMYYFNLVKWNINYKKSVLVPVRKITFLGAKWFSDKVVRTKRAT